MAKSIAVAGLLLWVGACAGFSPGDELSRSARAFYGAWHEECDGREETPGCVALQNAYNQMIDSIAAYNKGVQ